LCVLHHKTNRTMYCSLGYWLTNLAFGLQSRTCNAQTQRRFRLRRSNSPGDFQDRGGEALGRPGRVGEE
jgi:hypothetical protein